MELSLRKQQILRMADQLASQRIAWKRKNAYFHEQDEAFLDFLVLPGSRVLDLGCGPGDLLASLKPAVGVGVDFSAAMIEQARARHPTLQFLQADIEDAEALDAIEGPFDFIIISDTIGSLDDCQASLQLLHRHCRPQTRIIVSYYSHLWEPLLRVGEWLKLKMPQPAQNYLSPDDITNLLEIAGFEVVKREWRQLLPRRLLGVGHLVNCSLAVLPLLRRLCLRHYVVARSRRVGVPTLRSCSVVIPCRNEKGNIESAILRTPAFCEDMEFLFVEGHSQDGTLEEIQRVIEAYPDRDIKLHVQQGIGKADATYAGFDQARGDVLMILDADLTMPPEHLDKFWHAIAEGQGEYINGSRLVYPMEAEAMRFLNHLANRMFSTLFSWLLNQRYTDTLCGTKVLARADYLRLKANRNYFGDFDPFGDFFLIFGASRLSLKMVEIPIPYRARRYGETQIQRFRHGWQLLRMVAFAFVRLKTPPWRYRPGTRN